MPDPIRVLHNRLYNSLEEAQQAVHEIAKQAGYSLAVHQKKPNATAPRRVVLRCSKGRVFKSQANENTPPEKRRKKTSKMTACPYRITIKVLPSGKWVVVGVGSENSSTHNHPAALANDDESSSTPASRNPEILESLVFPRFSSDTEPAAALSKLAPLLASCGGRWTLAKDGEAIERSFKFKTFAKAWDFMTAVSLQCKLKNHHPEWSNVYNTAFIRWTTHNPQGLSDKDLNLATICDFLAKDFGEVLPESETQSCAVRDLADKAATNAGDCCAPRS